MSGNVSRLHIRQRIIVTFGHTHLSAILRRKRDARCGSREVKVSQHVQMQVVERGWRKRGNLRARCNRSIEAMLLRLPSIIAGQWLSGRGLVQRDHEVPEQEGRSSQDSRSNSTYLSRSRLTYRLPQPVAVNLKPEMPCSQFTSGELADGS